MQKPRGYTRSSGDSTADSPAVNNLIDMQRKLTSYKPKHANLEELCSFHNDVIPLIFSTLYNSSTMIKSFQGAEPVLKTGNVPRLTLLLTYLIVL